MVSISKHKKTGVHTKAFRGLLHTFVPHVGNDFHPHLIRPFGLIVVGIIVGILFMVGTSDDASSVKGVSNGISKEELLKESNKVRSDQGVPSLILNDSLSSAAGLKARDMLLNQYWDHTAPDGTTPWYWFREVNYRYDYAGENLAKGFSNAPGVVTGWMNSEEHRQNMLSPNYQDVGFGIADGVLKGEATTVVVAMYASPIGSAALESPEVLAATAGDMSLITRFGIGLQSLNPIMLGSIVVLAITSLVALATYAFRKKFPLEVRKDWKRHHALYKGLVTACLVLALITLYGDGQIL